MQALSVALFTATAVFVTIGHAIPLGSSDIDEDKTRNETSPKGYFQLDLDRSSHPLTNKRRVQDTGNPYLNKANQAVTDRLNNQRYFYSSTVMIGTPPQAVSLLVDTGSSDTWVFAPGSRHKGRKEKPVSFFDPSRSSTFKSNNTQYKLQYGIGTTTGTWGTDVFKIGDASISGFSIGVADTGDVSQGLIGIGRPEAEITYSKGFMYENLPLKLQSSGVIHTAAYSLYLNDLHSKSGSLLFGAVDRSKYVGTLYSMPITHSRHLGVQLKAMKSDGWSKGNLLSKQQTAVLDSGTSLTYMPGGDLEGLHVALNANPSFAIGQKYYCDCNVTKNLVFDFDGVKIKVPNYHFLWPINDMLNTIVANMAFPPNSCYIGIEKVQRGMDFMLLGDNVMRAMYVVYDITHKRIAVAQANLNPPAPNIQIIRDRIPGAIGY